MNKLITGQTNTTDGLNSTKFKYFIAPTVQEMVNKINELVEEVNKLTDAASNQAGNNPPNS